MKSLTIIIFLFILLSLISPANQALAGDDDLARLFRDRGVTGTIVIFSLKGGRRLPSGLLARESRPKAFLSSKA